MPTPPQTVVSVVITFITTINTDVTFISPLPSPQSPLLLQLSSLLLPTMLSLPPTVVTAASSSLLLSLSCCHCHTIKEGKARQKLITFKKRMSFFTFILVCMLYYIGSLLEGNPNWLFKKAKKGILGKFLGILGECTT
jgi:hypothetical protein